MGLARPSVCLSVRSIRAPNSITIKYKETKNGVNVDRVNRVPIFSSKGRGWPHNMSALSRHVFQGLFFDSVRLYIGILADRTVNKSRNDISVQASDVTTRSLAAFQQVGRDHSFAVSRKPEVTAFSRRPRRRCVRILTYLINDITGQQTLHRVGGSKRKRGEGGRKYRGPVGSQAA